MEENTLKFAKNFQEEIKPINGRRKARIWTNEEDFRLLAAIHKYGLNNWTEIVQFVGCGRTRPQCTQRWNRGLDPKICKNNWTEEENIKLLSLVSKHGETFWSKIAEEMGQRSDVQCRYHFFQLKKHLFSGKILDNGNYQLSHNFDNSHNIEKNQIKLFDSKKKEDHLSIWDQFDDLSNDFSYNNQSNPLFDDYY